MSTIGRNDPCPCGSGKKYKHCCLNSNIIPFPSQCKQDNENDSFQAYDNHIKNQDEPGEPPTFMEFMGSPNKATEQLHDLKKILENMTFNSLDEVNEFLRGYQKEISGIAFNDFLGLSPNQMHKILYTPFKDNSDILYFDINLTKQDVENIPVMVQTVYFLEKIKEQEPLKATKNGNMPRKFVQDLFFSVYNKYEELNFKPNKEADYPLIQAHKHILKMAGIIKKYKNTYCLTKKGRGIIESKDYNALYKLLFLNYIQKFNWGFLDRYNEFSIIQASWIFNLYILKKKAAQFTEKNILGKIYLKAFPDVVREATISFFSPEKEVIGCFALRFLQCFCISFGLLEEKKQGEKYKDQKLFYKTTELFDRLLKWKI